MIRVSEHLQKIEKAKQDLEKATSPMRKRDLKKYIYRLQKQQLMCEQYMERAQ